MLGLKRDTVPASGKLEQQIATLTSQRQTLLAKLSGAEQEHQRAVAKRLATVTCDEDDAKIAAANGEVAKAVEALSGFSAAVEDVDTRLAEAEAAFKNEQDRVARQRFADWCAGKISEIEGASRAFQAAAETLTAALRSTSRSGATVAAGLAQAANSFEIEVGTTLRDLTSNRDAVMSGAQDIPDARPKPPPAAAEMPDIERVSIYALKPLRWLDPADGRIRVVARHGIGALPKALGELVVAKNLGDISTSTRALDLMKAFGEVLWPPPAREAIDLDALAVETEATAEQQNEAVA
jgi:hypothetical protein